MSNLRFQPGFDPIRQQQLCQISAPATASTVPTGIHPNSHSATISVTLSCLACLALLLSGACSDGKVDAQIQQADSAVDTAKDIGTDTAEAGTKGLQPSPIGDGFCCPIDNPSCDGFRVGGWTAVDDVKKCPIVADLAPPLTKGTDDHGCQIVGSNHSCFDKPDTGHSNGIEDANPDSSDSNAISTDSGKTD